MKNSGVLMSVITAVPWNGHKAAASFTFDDASESHITNLMPLAERLDVKVTCFLTGDSYYFRHNYDKFLQMAQAGHEMGNHTETHPKLTQLGDADRKREILDYKKFLQEQMPGLPFNVFGTPYCDNNADVQKIIGQAHYISRDCRGYGRICWNKEPNWLSMDSKAWQRSLNTVEEFRQIARNTNDAGEWIIYMNHGVDEDQNNDYSINPEDLEAIIQQAKDLDMWIAPFGTVGAYHRAAFALEHATAQESEDGLLIRWKSPHAKMPESVLVKVRLDTDGNSKVIQNGNELEQNDDGSYTIDFMKLALDIIF
ncbi:MAG: polysaccharide deacetylase family protein [Fibrobacter sp.]|nr:polysaccharide deacetylase family protein [Fibrobacter sp.]